MYLCANAYTAKTENGVLDENVVGSWALKDTKSHRSVEPMENDVDTWIGPDGYDLYDPTYDFPGNELRLLIPSEQSEDIPSTIARDVNISHALLRSTIDYLNNYTSASKKLVAYPDRTSPIFLDALWNSTNLTSTFETVARSLTNQIRNTSPHRQEGTVQRKVIHVSVDWAYLVYPITMLLIGILHVVLIMIESMRLRKPAWKETALPTLLYGFDNETQRLLRKKQGYGGNTKTDTSVRFAYDEQEGCSRLTVE
jgi:hypothetical protein